MSYEYSGPGVDQEHTPPKSKTTRNCCLASCGGCGCLTILFVILCFVGYRYFEPFFNTGVGNAAITEAMRAYCLEHGHYPPAYSVDENGNPLHSWRVLILPYFDEKTYSVFHDGPLPSEVYSQIRLDEPWDSEHNRQAALQMPKCYQNSTLKEDGKTNCQMIIGERCLSNGPDHRTANEINVAGRPVIFFVDAYPTVDWMSPNDLSYEDMMANGVVSATDGRAGLACPHSLMKIPMGAAAASTGESFIYTDES